MLALPLVLTIVAASGIVAVRRWQTHIGRGTGHALDLVPVVLLLLSGWLEGILFQTAGEFNAKYTADMLWAGACLITLPALLCWGRVRAGVAGTLLVLSATIVLGDLWYLRFFGGLAPILAAGSGGQLWAVRDSIWELTRAADLSFLPIIALGVLVAFKWPRPALPLDWRVRLGSNALALVLLAWGALPIKRDLESWLADRHSWKIFNSKILITDAGLWGAHARDIAQSLREAQQAEHLSAARRDELRKLHAARLGTARSPRFGKASGKNVLVIQVEAMQQWVVDANIRGSAVMPFLRRLRERGVYYKNVWDQTGGSPTADCEYMIFNSQHPLAKGSVAFRRAGNQMVGLAGLLGEHGYQTFSAHAYSPSMWNRSVLHPKYGIASSAFAPELGTKPKLGWGLEDKVFFERTVPLLGKLQTPWFAFLVTLTSHHPYGYVPKERHEFQTPGLTGALSGYLHSMRYVDNSLATFFEELTKAHQLEDTLVVIYGDHDSKLTFGSKERKAADQLLDIDDRTLELLGRRSWLSKKIPLLFIPPAPAQAEIDPQIGGQIDIGPTILDWLGLAKSPAYLGQALGSTDNDDFVARHDGSAVSHKFIWDAQTKRCHHFSNGKKTSKKRCKSMRAAADREVEASWDVTLNDLAHELDSELRPAPH